MVVQAHVWYCDGGTGTCLVLWWWYTHMFGIVMVVQAHVWYCDGGTGTCLVLWWWYRHMFGIVTVASDEKFLKHWFRSSIAFYSLFSLCLICVQIRLNSQDFLSLNFPHWIPATSKATPTLIRTLMLHVATENSVSNKVFGCFNDHINQQTSNFGTS